MELSTGGAYSEPHSQRLLQCDDGPRPHHAKRLGILLLPNFSDVQRNSAINCRLSLPPSLETTTKHGLQL